MMKRQTLLFFTALLIISPFLFRDSFSMSFFQDDFFLLKISTVHSFTEWMRFFIPRTDVQFYRPLALEVFFWWNRLLFSFSPFWFHVSIWIVWIVTVVLVYFNSGWFLHSRCLRYLLTGLYALSAIHYNSLFWVANGSYIFSACFYFLCFYLWRRFRQGSAATGMLAGAYILGLLCSEFLLTIPFLLVLDTFLFFPKHWRQSLRRILLLFLITGVYLFYRLILFPPNTGTYHAEINSTVFSSYRWFMLFFLNWPETTKDWFLKAYLIRPDFLHTFPLEIAIFCITIAVFVVTVLTNLVATKLSILNRKMLFSLCWFLGTLTPIIFIPSHISPHQGSVSLFGFLLIFLLLLESGMVVLPRWIFLSLLYLLITVWPVSTAMTISLNNRVHWIYRRSELVKQWLTYVQHTHVHPASGQQIIIPTDEKEVRVALNDGEAIRQFFSDQTLQVVFQSQK